MNDGFLKQIRVGQFQADRTRVVLEVDSLSEYNTFLLSNPSRLIIDIHGKQQEVAKTQPSKPLPRHGKRKARKDNCPQRRYKKGSSRSR